MAEFIITQNMTSKIPAFTGENLINQSDDVKSLPVTHGKKDGAGYGISWGFGVGYGWDVTGEYGFFRNASWLDKLGIYWQSSLNTDEGMRAVLDFEPPENLISDVINYKPLETKYKQPMSSIKWTGVVLASQNPLDCNLAYVGPFQLDHRTGHDTYMTWYEDQCKRYGKSLLVKIHPFVAEIPQWSELFVQIADRYGASAAVCNMDCYTHAEKVICYTSTVALDCWMRDIPAEQTGRGTFMRYDNTTGKQLAHFLMWKYCIPTSLTRERWLDVFRQYRDSNDLYPLDQRYSWASWFKRAKGENDIGIKNCADGLNDVERVMYGVPRYTS